MANTVARQVFEGTKSSDIVLFTDKRPNSAVDLLTLYCIQRHAADRTRTAVHVLCFERRADFWQERLQPRLQNRCFVYDLSHLLLHGTDATAENNVTKAVSESVQKAGPSVCRHLVVFDSTSLLLLVSVTEFAALIVDLADRIGKLTGGISLTSIAILHHGDVFDYRAERALRAISTSTVTVSSVVQNKLGQQEFLCSVEHLRHQEAHAVKQEKITISDDWRAAYGPVDSMRSTVHLATAAGLKGDAADPTSNLSFNLRLTSQERTARDQVPLPHARGGSVIYYEPDEADDIDYEDPDE